MQQDKKLEVSIKSKNGLRYGKMKYGNLEEEFPKQIITSTNQGHINNFEKNVDLDTKSFQVFLNVNAGDFENNKYKSTKGKIGRAKGFVSISNRINWILIKDIFRTSRIGKKKIEDSLKLQEEINPKIKSLYIPKNLKPEIATELIQKHSDKIVYIDMNDTPTHFKKIYLSCINSGVKIVCFIIRKLSDNNVENYNLVAGRSEDNVLRIATELTKRSSIVGDRSLSLFFYNLGFDGFAFRGGSKPYNTTIENLAIYRKGMYKYENILEFNKCDCESHKGKVPYEEAKRYHELKKSSIPSSLHDHLELNEDFKEIRNKLIKNEFDINKLKEESEFSLMFNQLIESNKAKKK